MLTSKQLTECQAYDAIEPSPQTRLICQVAILCSIVANIGQVLTKKRGSSIRILKPTDFIPNFAGEEDEKEKDKGQSVKEIKAALLSWANAHNKQMDKLEAMEKRRTVKSPNTGIDNTKKRKRK